MLATLHHVLGIVYYTVILVDLILTKLREKKTKQGIR